MEKSDGDAVAANQLDGPDNPDPSQPGKRIWRAGTLTYTTAGLAILFCWLLWGDFAWQMKERAVTPVAQLMLKQFKASDFVVGLLVASIPAAFGLILGPIISVRSDRHRSKWGRRIPFLLYPTPIAALSMVGLAFTPVLGQQIHEWLGPASPGLGGAQIMAFSLFWGIFEVASTIANAVFYGLISDVVPDAVIGRFFGLFRAISLIAGIIFNFYIIGKAEQHYVAIFTIIGSFYGVGFLVMCFKVKEGEYPPPPPRLENGGLKATILAPIKEYIKECYANPYYLWVFGATTVAMLAAGPVNTFSLFAAKSTGMSVDTYGKYLALTYTISLCLAYILGALADRFHPLRISMIAIALYGVVMLWGGFNINSPGTFAFAFVAHGVLSGTYFTASASLGQRLFPKAKFAQFGSAAGIFGAAFFTILPPLVGAMLDATNHTYRYTFMASGVLGLLGFFGLYIVYRKFLTLGGDKHYVAPL